MVCGPEHQFRPFVIVNRHLPGGGGAVSGLAGRFVDLENHFAGVGKDFSGEQLPVSGLEKGFRNVKPDCRGVGNQFSGVE